MLQYPLFDSNHSPNKPSYAGKILGRDTCYREEYRDARDKRCAVESTISVVKDVY